MAEEVKPRTRYMLRELKAKIALKGLHAIDRRSGAAKHLIAWKGELVAAMGGAENCSPQKTAIIELAVRARAVLDHVDAYIMEQPSLINKRSRRVLPIVDQRTRLADHLAKLLAQLGLERIPKSLPTIQEYIREREEAEADTEKEGTTDEHRSVDE